MVAKPKRTHTRKSSRLVPEADEWNTLGDADRAALIASTSSFLRPRAQISYDSNPQVTSQLYSSLSGIREGSGILDAIQEENEEENDLMPVMPASNDHSQVQPITLYQSYVMQATVPNVTSAQSSGYQLYNLTYPAGAYATPRCYSYMAPVATQSYQGYQWSTTGYGVGYNYTNTPYTYNGVNTHTPSLNLLSQQQMNYSNSWSNNQGSSACHLQDPSSYSGIHTNMYSNASLPAASSKIAPSLLDLMKEYHQKERFLRRDSIPDLDWYAYPQAEISGSDWSSSTADSNSENQCSSDPPDLLDDYYQSGNRNQYTDNSDSMQGNNSVNTSALLDISALSTVLDQELQRKSEELLKCLKAQEALGFLSPVLPDDRPIPPSLPSTSLPPLLFRVYDTYSVSTFHPHFGFLSGFCLSNYPSPPTCYTFPSFTNFKYLLLKHTDWQNRRIFTPFISVTDSITRVAKDIRRRREVSRDRARYRNPLFAVISTEILVGMCGANVWKMDEMIELCGLAKEVPGKMEWYEREWVCKDQIPRQAVVAWDLNVDQLGFV